MMVEYKFNIGDKVRVLSGSKLSNVVGSWIPDMERVVGGIYTVEERATSFNNKPYYNLDGVRFHFDERCLQKVESDCSKYTITIKPKFSNGVRESRSIVSIENPNGKVTTVTTNYDESIIDTINSALTAQFGEDTTPEPEKFYQGRIVITGMPNDTMYTDAFTVGKIYPVVNGQLVGDGKRRFPFGGPVYNVDELRTYFRGSRCGVKSRVGFFGSEKVSFVPLVEEEATSEKRD